MVRNRIEILIREALAVLGVEANDIKLEHPADSTHGDYATNVALVYGKATKVAPLELAKKLVEELLHTSSKDVEKIEIAGPGFINFFLTDTALEQAVLQSGVPKTRKGEKINVEFISANPTGELHIGHGRGAFYGDTLARVLEGAGAVVTREFYINDSRESKQIKELGKMALGEGDQYRTPILIQQIEDENMVFDGLSVEDAGTKLAAMVQKGNEIFIQHKLGIIFKKWYSEEVNLRASGLNEKMLARLKKSKFTYEKDGALWLKTSEYGDDEDRVIVRSDGTMTYFIADIAYHQEKFDRGFQTVINVWGADHHGHIKRMHAAGRMLGWPPSDGANQPIIFIVQLVSLKEGNTAKKMSKRAGNVIFLDYLVENLGIDVVRWFFNEKALSTQMAFDMELALEKSDKNPVYYVQYAHARISAIIEKTKNLSESREGQSFADMMKIPSARALALKIAELPEIIVDTARDYNVHRITIYATALAVASNACYRDMRVVNEGSYYMNELILFGSAKVTISSTLSILGISAPDRM